MRPLVLCLLALAGLAAAEVERGAFLGWKDAVRLRNPAMTLTVVPGVGRLMELSTPTCANIIWSNPALVGVPLAEASAREPMFGWANYGGERFWTVQQSDNLQVRGGKSWPADEVFDGQPWACTVDADGSVRLHSGVSHESGVQAERTIRMAADRALVRIEQRLKAVPGERRGMLSLIQNVAVVRPPDLVVCELAPDTHFRSLPIQNSGVPDGISPQTFPKGEAMASFLRTEGGFAFLTRPRADFTGKFYADVRSGWICAFYGDEVHCQLFTFRPGAYYPDGGCSAEVYVSVYYELELLSPAAILRDGEELRSDIGLAMFSVPGATALTPLAKAQACRAAMPALRKAFDALAK